MSQFTYDQLVSALRKNVECIVEFTKVDGTRRTMRCTLNRDTLPVRWREERSQIEHDYNDIHPGLVPVWDLEKKGWRAFRVDSVLSFSVVGYGSEGEEITEPL